MDYIYDFDVHYDNYTYIYEGNYTPVEEAVSKHQPTCLNEALCALFVVVIAAIFLLGICGNALVIWISGFKMKKTVNTTWYTSLAVSDLVFCAVLPLTIANVAMEQWIFGRFMCKFASSVMFLNMFSSIFLLVVISIDRCVSVLFPVWAQNHRTVKMASVVVLICWLLAIAMSLPSAVFREVNTHIGRTVCYNNYTLYQHSHEVVVVSRFLVGFVVPFVVIIACYSIIVLKLRSNRVIKSSKPIKVMSALVAAFFICWLPYHVSVLLELKHGNYNHRILIAGLHLGFSTAAANSILNPVLYVFMGNDFKQKFKSSMLSKMENAMAEEGRTTSRYLSRSSSMDGRASTHI